MKNFTLHDLPKELKDADGIQKTDGFLSLTFSTEIRVSIFVKF